MKRIRQKKKILIIDNASNDGSIEEVVKEYPEVECVMLWIRTMAFAEQLISVLKRQIHHM